MALNNPATRYTTLPEFTLSYIRAKILKGELLPGEKVDQVSLAEELGVSKIPIREALRTLEAERLVSFRHNQGAIVTALTPEEAEEIFVIRCMLEGMASKIAATNMMTDSDIQNIQRIFEGLHPPVDNPDEWLTRHSRFHMSIYEVADRPRLLDLIQRLHNCVQPYIRRYILSSQHMELANQGHAAIIQACIDGDPKAAERATKEHLEQTWQVYLSLSKPSS